MEYQGLPRLRAGSEKASEDGRETVKERGHGGRRQDSELEQKEVNGTREQSIPARMVGGTKESAGRAGR